MQDNSTLRNHVRCPICGRKLFIVVGKTNGQIEIKCRCKTKTLFILTEGKISDKIIITESQELLK